VLIDPFGREDGTIGASDKVGIEVGIGEGVFAVDLVTNGDELEVRVDGGEAGIPLTVVDEQQAAALEIAFAPAGDEAGKQRHEQVEALVGFVDAGLKVDPVETDGRLALVVLTLLDEGVVGRVGEERCGFFVVIHVDGGRVDEGGRDVDETAGVEDAFATILLVKLAEQIQPLKLAVDVEVIIEFGDGNFSHSFLN